MFEEGTEFTIKDDQNKCKNCMFYLWIDSGYGRCRRFPPITKNIGKWWKPHWVAHYQLVEWDRKACGEFQKRWVKDE